MPRFVLSTLFALCLAYACVAAHAQRAPAQSVGVQRVVISTSETPVRMQKETIAVDIGGGMAETTIEMVFHNPSSRVLEAPLLIPLGPGQRVIGFALDIDGEMRDAVPVEKTRGRQVFEAIERRGVDPGLLESSQGNSFQLRLYPIPANGNRTVRLRIAQALERAGGGWTYRLPQSRRMDNIEIKASVTVHGAQAAPTLPDSPAQVHFQPTADGLMAELPREAVVGGLSVDGKLDAGPRAWTGEFGDASWFYAELPVDSPPRPRSLARTVGLLWDSSGSGAARRHDLEYALLDRYFKTVGNVDVRLTRLRDRADAPRSYRVQNGDWSALRRELEATVYDGATALGGWTPERQVGEYLLFSDGQENYGARRFPALAPQQRLFAVDASPSGDDARLNALAQQHGGRLVRLGSGVDDAARELLFEPARIATLDGDGLADLQAESMEARDGVLRIAGRRLRQDGLLRVTLSGAGASVGVGVGKTIEVPVNAASPRQPLAPTLWAGWRIDALQADYASQRSEIARIARRFGIATRDTSLIVLERLDDYVRYKIDPPAGLRDAVEKVRIVSVNLHGQDSRAHLERVVRDFEAKLAWWKTRFPKDRPPADHPGAPGPGLPESGVIYAPPVNSPPMLKQPFAIPAPPPPPAPAPAPAPIAAPQTLSYSDTTSYRRAPAAPIASTTAVSGSRVANTSAAPAPAPIGIALQKWTPDERYLERMRHADAAQAYAIYLDQKPDFANSTAFYLDVADQLFDKGARELALRVLSNLAEMELENRQVLRVLGTRLMQAGAPELAVPVFEQVRDLAEDEPQSWRDLGLAYAAAGRAQDAVDTLYEVALRPWDARFPDIELIALADMNAIVAAAKDNGKGKGRIDTSRIDPRLLRAMPLDLRVVLTWDADNTDMDLWVTDPNGERCMFSNPSTYQGGRLSHDVTGGYGPEEFSLREAKPGKYKVEANFYGHRQQLAASSTTLQLKLVTGFGTPHAKEKMVTLRLRGRGETVLVGEFEVPAARR